jgi:hypothetical protein
MSQPETLRDRVVAALRPLLGFAGDELDDADVLALADAAIAVVMGADVKARIESMATGMHEMAGHVIARQALIEEIRNNAAYLAGRAEASEEVRACSAAFADWIDSRMLATGCVR